MGRVESGRVRVTVSVRVRVIRRVVWGRQRPIG